MQPLPILRPNHPGELFGIVGNMTTGKTTRLISIALEPLYRRAGVLVVLPGVSSRTGDRRLQARTLATFPDAVPVASVSEIFAAVLAGTQENIFIDEIQFFEQDQREAEGFFSLALAIRDSGRNLFWSGLPVDFRRRPFRLVADLMAMSDHLDQLTTHCALCGHRPAHWPQRLEFGQPVPDNHPRFLADTPENNVTGITYEPRCAVCHQVPAEWNPTSQLIHAAIDQARQRQLDVDPRQASNVDG